MTRSSSRTLRKRFLPTMGRDSFRFLSKFLRFSKSIYYCSLPRNFPSIPWKSKSKKRKIKRKLKYRLQILILKENQLVITFKYIFHAKETRDIRIPFLFRLNSLYLHLRRRIYRPSKNHRMQQFLNTFHEENTNERRVSFSLFPRL